MYTSNEIERHSKGLSKIHVVKMTYSRRYSEARKHIIAMKCKCFLQKLVNVIDLL